MFASYTVTRYVNLPDQVGVNTDKGLLMLDCEPVKNACACGEIARYAGSLKDEYDIEVIIRASSDETYTILARGNAYDYEDEDDDYYDEDDELFYETCVEEKDVISVLGKAFAAVEKSTNKNVCRETSEKKTDCPKEKSLKKLRDILNALFDEIE